MREALSESLHEFWGIEPFATPQQQKELIQLPHLNLLSQFHRQHCQGFSNVCNGMHWQNEAGSLADVPFLAVRLFKQFDLHSLGAEPPFKTLQSSGTTAQSPSVIRLDRQTSSGQSKALVKTLQADIGKQRLPMLIIDSPEVLQDKALFSARGAGIQGLSLFGRDHTYALNADMTLNLSAINTFAEKYAGQPVLLFGFTFMVWLHWVQALLRLKTNIDLPEGILLHSGGWKKLVDQQVDNTTFKQQLCNVSNISRVVNFYGMAEQVGSIFTECSEGHLHCSVFNDVIIRDSYDFSIKGVGETGLIQTLSILPMSYPGHSLLTEDKGELLGIDDCRCGRKGKYFKVQGRLPKVEVRGCSDTYGKETASVL